MEMEDFSCRLVAEYFSALSHPVRLKILELLSGGERCVCEIFPAIGAEQSNTSRHLSVLRRAGILRERRQGVKIFYAVGDKRVFEIINAVKKIGTQEALARAEALK
jgi:ArsR family transcriptional regulator